MERKDKTLIFFILLIILGLSYAGYNYTQDSTENKKKEFKPPHSKSNDYFATYGNISSKYKIEEGQSWINKLDRLGDNIRENNSLSPYFYPNGSIISYGHDRWGYFVVSIDKNSTVSKTTLDEIYGIIDDEAQKMGIYEVPVAFRYTSIPRLD